MSDVIRTVENARVEVIDLLGNIESPNVEENYPEERSYVRVELLESGWIRAIGPTDAIAGDEEPIEDDGTASVDYFPPERINGIFSVERVQD